MAPVFAHGIFARVSWPNIGPAAAGHAGPAPTALRKDSRRNQAAGPAPTALRKDSRRNQAWSILVHGHSLL